MQRINLYPSPLTPLVNDGTGDITHGDYDVAIDNLEAGTYVFAADIQNSGTQTGINVMLFDSGWNPLSLPTRLVTSRRLSHSKARPCSHSGIPERCDNQQCHRGARRHVRSHFGGGLPSFFTAQNAPY